MDLNKLQALADLAEQLENQGFMVEANNVHNLFLKQADSFNKSHMVEFPMDVEDAVNNYDSKIYQLDTEGEWQNTVSIPDFVKQAPDKLMHAPAAVDKNHIVFENPENKKIEVMNVIPEQHMDTIHNPNEEDDEKFIKRADD